MLKPVGRLSRFSKNLFYKVSNYEKCYLPSDSATTLLTFLKHKGDATEEELHNREPAAEPMLIFSTSMKLLKSPGVQATINTRSANAALAAVNVYKKAANLSPYVHDPKQLGRSSAQVVGITYEGALIPVGYLWSCMLVQLVLPLSVALLVSTWQECLQRSSWRRTPP